MWSYSCVFCAALLKQKIQLSRNNKKIPQILYLLFYFTWIQGLDCAMKWSFHNIFVFTKTTTFQTVLISVFQGYNSNIWYQSFSTWLVPKMTYFKSYKAKFVLIFQRLLYQILFFFITGMFPKKPHCVFKGMHTLCVQSAKYNFTCFNYIFGLSYLRFIKELWQPSFIAYISVTMTIVILKKNSFFIKSRHVCMETYLNVLLKLLKQWS